MALFHTLVAHVHFLFQKKGYQVQHYEPLPSSDEETEESSSSTQLPTKANIKRRSMRRVGIELPMYVEL